MAAVVAATSADAEHPVEQLEAEALSTQAEA
jgi:hypothetical protein